MTTLATTDSALMPESVSRSARLSLFLGLASVGCAIDLVTKWLSFRWLGQPNGVENIHWIAEGYVGFETALNRGALFGMGQGMVWLFALMSFAALLGVGVWLTHFGGFQDRLLTIALGVVTGGILGNLYDRLGIWSGGKICAVRDFIRLSYNYDQYVWPNFNVADSLLICGAVLLIWHSFQNPHSTSDS